MAPLVSVVVATRNRARTLPTALDAIVQQDYPDVELVVVADPSDDDTDRVLDEWIRAVRSERVSFASRWEEADDAILRSEHPRYRQDRTIRIIRNPELAGQTASYNIGVQAARGAFVTLVADDDIPHPEMISALAKALDAGADYAYADMWIVDDAMRILREFRLPDFDPRRCLADWYLLGVCRLYRRELHDRAGWYDPAYEVAQDYDMALRFAMAGARFVHVPRVLYSHRFHGEGRKSGAHAPEKERRILEESKRIARRAREWLASIGGGIPAP
jgi:glycosyltransferase involved in cell wall biosynthesis